MKKYLMTHAWLEKLVPQLRLCDVTRVSYQQLLNDYAVCHERQTTMDFHHQLKGAIMDAVDDGLIERDPTRKAIIKGKTPAEKKIKYLNHVGYEARELTEYSSLYGRLILKFHKTSMQGVMKYETVCDEITVHELLPDTFEGDDFPGYDNVRLSYDQLNRIIVNQKRDWIAALGNQKAVYLITDTNTGKLYVGSATSDNGMLLARWSAYSANGHGGNVELVKLVEQEGFDYIKKYFTYAILENYNAKVDDHVILSRESWWKETLKTRQFGYNDN